MINVSIPIYFNTICNIGRIEEGTLEKSEWHQRATP